MKKRLLYVLIVSALLFILCCGSVFAVCESVPINKPIFSVTDDVGTIGILKSSILDVNSRNFLLDLYKNNDDFFIALSSDRSIVCFFKIVGGSPSIFQSTNRADSNIYFKYLTINSVSFDVNTGNPVRKDIQLNSTPSYFVTSTYGGTGFGFNFFIQYAPLSKYGLNKQNARFYVWSSAYKSTNGRVNYKFDDLIVDTPVSSTTSSDTPVSSTTSSDAPVSSTTSSDAPVSSTTVSEPTSSTASQTAITINYDYVPFSHKAINNFLDNVRHGVGISANIGWLLWFSIIGVCVVLNLIRYLTR